MTTISTNFNNPVPNGPFYSSPNTYLKGPYHPWIPNSVTGFDFSNGTFTSGGGGGGGTGTVTQINTGAGLTGGPITNTGTVSIAITGVSPGTYNNPVISVNSLGQLTFASSGQTPLLLTGGVMTGLITFAGGQTFANTVSSVSGIAPISVANISQNLTVSVSQASTTQSGVVQLNNTLNATATNQALTAAQGKALQDQINALLLAGGLVLAGALQTTTGLMSSVTGTGFINGFAVGSPLPSPASTNLNNFVVCDSAGTYTPPGGTAYTVNRGDWFFSDGLTWQYFPAGAYYGYASTTSPGIVELSTNSETIAGLDANLAVTPTSLQSKVASDTLIGLTRYATDGEALNQVLNNVALTPSNLPFILASVSAVGLIQLASSVEVITGTDAVKAITPATLVSRVATNSATGLVRLASAAETITGTDNTLAITPLDLSSRVATPTNTGIIRIATNAEVLTGTDNTVALTPQNYSSRVATKTTTGLIQLATSAETITGTDDTKAVTPADLTARTGTLTTTGIVQLEDSITSTSVTTAATPNSVRLAVSAGILKSTLSGKGSILAASAASTPQEQIVGSDGQILVADSATSTGLSWTSVINGGTY